MQSIAIEVALRIGMIEALQVPLTGEELARRLSIGHRGTDALLSVLAGCGLVRAIGDRRTLTDVAREYLLAASPFFKGPLFRTMPDERLEVIRTVHLQDGMVRPETARWAAGAVERPAEQGALMHAHSFAAATAFARQPCFATIARLLDLAGGVGTAAIALATANPGLRCTVMDLPAMAAEARRHAERFEIGDRVDFTGANMFEDAWPAGYDAVYFSNIFHDWDDSRCARLTRRAFDLLPQDGRIFVVEMLLDEGKDGPLAAALFFATMLFSMEGRQLTYSALGGLLQAAGFVDIERLASFGYYSLVGARRP